MINLHTDLYIQSDAGQNPSRLFSRNGQADSKFIWKFKAPRMQKQMNLENLYNICFQPKIMKRAWHWHTGW